MHEDTSIVVSKFYLWKPTLFSSSSYLPLERMGFMDVRWDYLIVPSFDKIKIITWPFIFFQNFLIPNSAN